MKGEKTRAYVDRLIREKGIPYIDFCASVGQEEVLRYYAALDGKATGKESLRLFSCTKPFTSVCAMRLAEEGRLALDDGVEKYIPEYGRMFLADGSAVENKMTVRHLLTMSAGLSYHVGAEPYKSLIQGAGKDATTLEIVRALAKAPLLFEPGARFEYSLCHDVLGAVIEIASGKRFSEYMQETVFTPLGMTGTGFHIEDRTAIADTYRCVSGRIVKDGGRNELVFTDRYDSGGAGAIGCVEDYAKFARTLACGGVAENGYRLLQEESLQQIRTEQHASMTVKNTFTCVQGDDYGYGLGMRTRMKALEWGLPVGEFGWDGAAGTYLMVDPAHKISVVIGMHLRNWPEAFQGEHLKLVQLAYEDMRDEGLL